METWNTVDDGNFMDVLIKIAKKRFPAFKIKYKNESIFMKIIGLLMFYNRKFMTEYTSTFFQTVWYPSKKYVETNSWRAGKVLAHELVHMSDNKEHPVLFKLMYLFPQWIAIFSLVSIVAIWYSMYFLLALFFLLAIVPWPSLPRTQLELRGYAMTIAINYWKHGSILDKTKDDIVKLFVGPAYYYMWRSEKDVKKWIEEAEEKIRNIDVIGKESETVFQMGEVFEDVYELVTGVVTED